MYLSINAPGLDLDRYVTLPVLLPYRWNFSTTIHPPPTRRGRQKEFFHMQEQRSILRTCRSNLQARKTRPVAGTSAVIDAAGLTRSWSTMMPNRITDGYVSFALSMLRPSRGQPSSAGPRATLRNTHNSRRTMGETRGSAA